MGGTYENVHSLHHAREQSSTLQGAHTAARDCSPLYSLVQGAADVSFASATIDRPDARCLCVLCVSLCFSRALYVCVCARVPTGGISLCKQ